MSSLEKCLFRSLPFFDLVACFSSIDLYELLVYLEINSLSVIAFAIIFSHFQGCLFTLFIVSLAAQKLLSLIRSHFIFVFISITLGGGSQEIMLSIYAIDCSAYVFLYPIHLDSLHLIYKYSLLHTYHTCVQMHTHTTHCCRGTHMNSILMCEPGGKILVIGKNFQFVYHAAHNFTAINMIL